MIKNEPLVEQADITAAEHLLEDMQADGCASPFVKIAAHHFALSRLQARPDASDVERVDEAKDELRRLIESIWRAEYRTEAPDWRPLPDLIGMITQIDNMYAGVRSQRDEALAALNPSPVQEEERG